MNGPAVVRWARYSNTGYEVSSAGDQRFSALFAEMPDGRTIEMHYQCDVKGFNPGGTNWRAYKGKAGSLPPRGRLSGIMALWREWSLLHPELIDELDREASAHDDVLTDRFARSDINQAHALAVILNMKRLKEWQML